MSMDKAAGGSTELLESQFVQLLNAITSTKRSLEVQIENVREEQPRKKGNKNQFNFNNKVLDTLDQVEEKPKKVDASNIGIEAIDKVSWRKVRICLMVGGN